MAWVTDPKTKADSMKDQSDPKICPSRLFVAEQCSKGKGTSRLHPKISSPEIWTEP